jgi:biopolymer transport protein ExbD
MRFKRRVAIFSGQLELTPLVDVVLLLLIFFVLSSRYLANPGISVDVPESAATTDVEASDLILTITDKNEVYLRGKLISPLEGYEQLRAELQKVKLSHGDEVPRLIVQGDKKIPLGRAIEIMSIAWEEGFHAQSLATQPREAP